ncbi:DUF4238 domain-containing protein [Undibacterium sp. Di27W]|uniref:DUF4238 domain-containing protein n=1 Tax=Undibacterium sp. Di27W TaxID=3413036 RepID=UPI003BF3C5E8
MHNWSAYDKLCPIRTKLVDTVLPLLGGRNWQLLREPADAGGFVTSDHLVVLQWSEQKDRGSFYSPSFGLKGTEVVFPISNELAMVRVFGGHDGVVDITPDVVAQIMRNSCFYMKSKTK